MLFWISFYIKESLLFFPFTSWSTMFSSKAFCFVDQISIMNHMFSCDVMYESLKQIDYCRYLVISSFCSYYIKIRISQELISKMWCLKSWFSFCYTWDCERVLKSGVKKKNSLKTRPSYTQKCLDNLVLWTKASQLPFLYFLDNIWFYTCIYDKFKLQSS